MNDEKAMGQVIQIDEAADSRPSWRRWFVGRSRRR